MRELRKVLGLTQEDLASWLSLTAGTVSRWERGKTIPAFTVGQFELILDALSGHGYTLSDLRQWVTAEFKDLTQG